MKKMKIEEEEDGCKHWRREKLIFIFLHIYPKLPVSLMIFNVQRAAVGYSVIIAQICSFSDVFEHESITVSFSNFSKSTVPQISNDSSKKRKNKFQYSSSFESQRKGLIGAKPSLSLSGKMTVDDENSIYVGGLPYECTESQLRRVFELYGSVVAIKIINDRGVGGKCYGFITFTNPRSAAEAIDEMDGRTIGGRVVRVNEVKSRGAGMRSNYGRENLRRNERDLDWDKGRGRERESDYGKDRLRDHSREGEGERDRRYDHTRDHDYIREPIEARDRDKGRDVEEWERDYSRSRDREWVRDDDLDATRDRQLARDDDHDRKGEKNKDQHMKRKNSSSSYDRESRELSSESSEYYHQMEEQLDLLIKRREELQKEKSDMEQTLADKKQLIVDLQKRSLKLEDALTSSKKLSSKRQTQLSKLYKCFQQVQEYGEKLKSSEEDLQDLVDSVSMEIDADGDLGTADVYLTNGKA